MIDLKEGDRSFQEGEDQYDQRRKIVNNSSRKDVGKGGVLKIQKGKDEDQFDDIESIEL